MDLLNYKNLSTSEKVLLVEEIWDSIAEDKLALSKQNKQLLDERLEELGTTTRRTTWDKIKKNARASKSK